MSARCCSKEHSLIRQMKILTSADGQYLPLRDVSANPARSPSRRQMMARRWR